MAARSGKCINFGLCNKADSREVVSSSEDFMCPECGKALSTAGSEGGKGPGTKLLVPLVVIIALLGAGSYWLLSDHNTTSQGETQADQNQVQADQNQVQTDIVSPPPLPQDDTQQQSQPQTQTESPIGDRQRQRRDLQLPQRPAPILRPDPKPEQDKTQDKDDKSESKEVEPPPKPVNLDLKGTTTLTAKLLSPISTRLSREGDKFTAEVEDGPYKGSILTGTITKLEKKKKNAELSFAFETISTSGRSTPIKADLKSVENAKGVKGVDEEGNVISDSSKKKVGLITGIGSGIGAGIGALTGGGKGALIGAGAGAGAGFLASQTLVSRASEVDFAPGSRFILDVSSTTNKR
jgi:hypothetical protein